MRQQAMADAMRSGTDAQRLRMHRRPVANLTGSGLPTRVRSGL